MRDGDIDAAPARRRRSGDGEQPLWDRDRFLLHHAGSLRPDGAGVQLSRGGAVREDRRAHHDPPTAAVGLEEEAGRSGNDIARIELGHEAAPKPEEHRRGVGQLRAGLAAVCELPLLYPNRLLGGHFLDLAKQVDEGMQRVGAEMEDAHALRLLKVPFVPDIDRWSVEETEVEIARGRERVAEETLLDHLFGPEERRRPLDLRIDRPDESRLLLPRENAPSLLQVHPEREGAVDMFPRGQG